MSKTVYSAYWLNLLSLKTTTSAAPSLVTDGVALKLNLKEEMSVVRYRHKTTAGNDARTFTVALWGYCPGEVDADGDDIASTAGWCNLEEGYSLVSISADGSVAKQYRGLTAFSRLFAQVTAISGTGAAVSVAIGLNSEE